MRNGLGGGLLATYGGGDAGCPRKKMTACTALRWLPSRGRWRGRSSGRGRIDWARRRGEVAAVATWGSCGRRWPRRPWRERKKTSEGRGEKDLGLVPEGHGVILIHPAPCSDARRRVGAAATANRLGRGRARASGGRRKERPARLGWAALCTT